MTATLSTYKCPKCNGSGFLSHYSGIANGVCFSCEGNGFKFGNPAPVGRMFAVTAENRETGATDVIYNIRAKTAAEAVAKAAKTYAKASPAWQARYDMSQALAA